MLRELRHSLSLSLSLSISLSFFTFLSSSLSFCLTFSPPLYLPSSLFYSVSVPCTFFRALTLFSSSLAISPSLFLCRFLSDLSFSMCVCVCVCVAFLEICFIYCKRVETRWDEGITFSTFFYFICNSLKIYSRLSRLQYSTVYR